MEGFDRPWWVIGGWTIETVTGVEREHDDLDISMFADDAEAFRLFLRGRWTPWNVHQSWLRPFDDRFTDIHPESQLWVRRDSRSPWVLDVPLTVGRRTGGRVLWTNKRLHEHVAPLDEVTWVADDGLRYLRPEVTLMMKARLDRPKDRADLDAALPLLDDLGARLVVGDGRAGAPGARVVERRTPAHDRPLRWSSLLRTSGDEAFSRIPAADPPTRRWSLGDRGCESRSRHRPHGGRGGRSRPSRDRSFRSRTPSVTVDLGSYGVRVGWPRA